MRRRHTVVQGYWSSDVLSSDVGEGRALVNQYLNAGVYKADGSGDTVEFASGSFLVVPGGSTGGVLLGSGEHTSELQAPCNLVCRLLLGKKKLHQPRDRGTPSLLRRRLG